MAFLIKEVEPVLWLKGINELKMSLENIEVYAIGGNHANTTWGCLVICNSALSRDDVGRHELCQSINPLLYIPEYSMISPEVTPEETKKMFGNVPHLYHPETGLVPLEKPVNWAALLLHMEELAGTVEEPEQSVFVPRRIEKFMIKALPQEEMFQMLEKEVSPEKLEDKPLDTFEKVRLKFLEALMGDGKKGGRPVGGKGRTGGFGGGVAGGGFGGGLGGMFGAILGGMGSLIPGMDRMTQSMMQELEELQRRNKSELEKLMDMMKDNPEEALKYAIPLDEDGVERGGMAGAFNMTKRWDNFSLFGNSGSRNFSGGGVGVGDMGHIFKLRTEYKKAAEELKNQKKYKKAAFIYLKLLKDHKAAAETLVLGRHYQDAAAIYLKYLKDKPKAADCYEKGLFFEEAIELYKEVKNHEKAGDLLMRINEKQEALEQYELLADEYIRNSQYVKASLVYRNKMHDGDRGQAQLLKGWIENKGAYNCLNNYFYNIKDNDEALDKIKMIYTQHVDKGNNQNFLKLISIEYGKREDVGKQIKGIAYEIISTHSIARPLLVKYLEKFNDDEHINTDIQRYIVNERNKKEGRASFLHNLQQNRRSSD